MTNEEMIENAIVELKNIYAMLLDIRTPDDSVIFAREGHLLGETWRSLEEHLAIYKGIKKARGEE